MSTKIYGAGVSRVGVREITPDIFWICHCVGKGAPDVNGGFAADFARINPNFDPQANDIIYSAYLFVGERTLLIDTLGPAQHATVLEALAGLLEGRSLDYLWISHMELPHAANTAAIRRAHPELELLTVAGHDHYEVHGLGDARRLDFGDTIDLGGPVLEIIKPLFVDHALTRWIYERHSGFLRPVDWAAEHPQRTSMFPLHGRDGGDRLFPRTVHA